MTAIHPAISSELFYWADRPDEQALASKEDKVAPHFTDEYSEDIKVSSAQKEAALYGIYSMLEGKSVERVQEKRNGPYVAPSELDKLTPLALLYAIYAEITEANWELQRSMARNLEQMHQAENALQTERLKLNAQQIQKFIEAQEKAHNGEIVTIVFDLIVGAVEIFAGVAQLSVGISTGNPFKIASGSALLAGGVCGLGNALLETLAFCSDDPSFAHLLKEYGAFARSAQAACTLISFAIDGMGATYEWLQGSRMASGVARMGEAQNNVIKITTRRAAESVGNGQAVVVRVEEDTMARLNTLQRLAQSALPTHSSERFLKLLSASMQHLYIITSVTHQLLQVFRQIVSGVIGREIAQSEAQGKKLQGQGEFLKTLTSIQRELINQLLKQERENAVRIVNDQTTLLQSSRMLSQSSLRVVNALAQAA